MLNVCFVKPLSRFDKRQIVRFCPRPDVDCVYTPILDKFLHDLVPKYKSGDKVLRKTQDLLLDVAGPIAMSYKMVWQAMENALPLDLSILLTCLTRSLQLLGNVINHVSTKCRAQVLSKIGPKYASLSNESWETNGRELFGKQFEQRLQQRAERVKAISTTSFVQRGKPFFPIGTPSTKPCIEGVRPVAGVLISKVSPIVLPGHSGEVEKQQHPSPSQPLQTSEESSSWNRCVPRTFFTAHSFKATYWG